MLCSLCDKCCHFKDGKCLANQFYIATPKNNLAPGFCRIFRDKRWAESKNTTQENLIQLSRKESELNYDLIFVHNNDDHLETLSNSLMVLSSTNNFNNVCKRIIIADTTRKSDRKQIMSLFKSYKGPKKLDVLVDGEEEKLQETIKRISRLLNQKYFVVIPSSRIISGRDNEIMINETNKDTRFIFWPFMNRLAQTTILPLHPVYGLYIKPVYDKLTRLTENPTTFYENLQQEEITTGIRLSHPLDIEI